MVLVAVPPLFIPGHYVYSRNVNICSLDWCRDGLGVRLRLFGRNSNFKIGQPQIRRPLLKVLCGCLLLRQVRNMLPKLGFTSYISVSVRPVHHITRSTWSRYVKSPKNVNSIKGVQIKFLLFFSQSVLKANNRA